MVKEITLRCPECGETVAFHVGAGTQLAGWHDVSARIADKKEYEKLMEITVKAASQKNKAAVQEFLMNSADVLENIRYELCGVETRKLLVQTEEGDAEKYFGEAAKQSIAASTEKWKAAAQREGLTAFEAIYLCPKTQRAKQGMYVALRWKEGGEEKIYVMPNKCDDCTSALVLADDGNIGFMHEGALTAAHCDACNAPLCVASVSFKTAQSEK